MKKPLSVLAAALAAGTIFTSSVSPASAAFTDTVGTIYEGPVDFLMKNEISTGYPGVFGVEMPIKRVDAAIMIAKYLELEVQNTPKTNFKDVPARAVPYVAALKEAGIVNGKSDVYFGAADNITRGEAAVIFMNAYGMELDGEFGPAVISNKFTDVTGRYIHPVNFLIEHGVIRGKSNNKFGVNDPLTRGQFALMVFRMHLDQRGTIFTDS